MAAGLEGLQRHALHAALAEQPVQFSVHDNPTARCQTKARFSPGVLKRA